MEQVTHDTAAGNSLKRHTSPEVKVVFVKAQHVLCGSLYGSPSSNQWSDGSDSIGGLGGDE
ncbi:MAG: hypothetical protein MJZ17_03090 [Bacteroidales bacterium]|nr:hypothetical protein [Bacteroidales bacterium]